MKKSFCLLLFAVLLFSCGQKPAPQPVGPVPNQHQLQWHDMEYYAFLHFSMNTFTDQEWGDGSNPASVFNPTDLDADSWAKTCVEAGMKGIIITAKHHCGFCLWPSAYTEYSVKNSPWKDGKGDIVKDLSEACKKYGLKLGVYLSPWDRNHAQYGSPEYITYFRNQLTELLTQYGDVFEVWFDGANGGDGWYGGASETRRIDNKTYYDWPNTIAMVRSIQPNAILFSDGGPDIRWCGNEKGYVGETNWCLQKAGAFMPGVADNSILETGLEDGDCWCPAEVDVSIRPGWFYHQSEDSRVKTPSQLMGIYLTSVGRGSNLILNIPIDLRGRFDDRDTASLLEFGQRLRQSFQNDLLSDARFKADVSRGRGYEPANLKADDETYYAAPDGVQNVEITSTLPQAASMNAVVLKETISLGQRVGAFTLEARVDGEWKQVAEGTTIGHKRILSFPEVKADALRLKVTKSKDCPVLSFMGAYLAQID